jgi:short subunit dehydrogenase-like uncharacterized protein
MRMSKLMIYGASGYTGQLTSLHANNIGLEVILAGRTAGKLQRLASDLNLPYLVFEATDISQRLDSVMKSISVLLNCAGPFHRTARPLIEACIRNGVHYLDTAAELSSYEIAEELDQRATEAKVMLMPGCGGSVAMLGCLAMHVVKQTKIPVGIDIALHVAGPVSRGSAISAQEGAMATQHKNQLVEKSEDEVPLDPKVFDFGDGRGGVTSFPTKLPDLITLRKATGVSNVQTFVHVFETEFPTGDLSKHPDGPTAEERNANPYHASVEIVAQDGTIKRAVLHTVNGYTFTSVASAEAGARVLAGEFLPGFQTPVGVFGSNFVESILASEILDV